jgi:hypothetical protein
MPDPSPSRWSSDIAEQILQRIYGDDFTGCNVDPGEIAKIVENGVQEQIHRSGDLLELYEKVVEAVELLSTPPEAAKLANQADLTKLLGERLDAIRSVATKTRETVAKFKGTTS